MLAQRYLRDLEYGQNGGKEGINTSRQSGRGVGEQQNSEDLSYFNTTYLLIYDFFLFIYIYNNTIIQLFWFHNENRLNEAIITKKKNSFALDLYCLLIDRIAALLINVISMCQICKNIYVTNMLTGLRVFILGFVEKERTDVKINK